MLNKGLDIISLAGEVFWLGNIQLYPVRYAREGSSYNVFEYLSFGRGGLSSHGWVVRHIRGSGGF